MASNKYIEMPYSRQLLVIYSSSIYTNQAISKSQRLVSMLVTLTVPVDEANITLYSPIHFIVVVANTHLVQQ